MVRPVVQTAISRLLRLSCCATRPCRPTARGDALPPTPAGTYAGHPVWSPDGARTAFASDRFAPLNAVPSDPGAWAEGRDPQLAAAVHALMPGVGGACQKPPAQP